MLNYFFDISIQSTLAKKRMRSHGLVVRVVALEARGPGFDSSSD